MIKEELSGPTGTFGQHSSLLFFFPARPLLGQPLDTAQWKASTLCKHAVNTKALMSGMGHGNNLTPRRAVEALQ